MFISIYREVLKMAEHKWGNEQQLEKGAEVKTFKRFDLQFFADPEPEPAGNKDIDILKTRATKLGLDGEKIKTASVETLLQMIEDKRVEEALKTREAALAKLKEEETKKQEAEKLKEQEKYKELLTQTDNELKTLKKQNTAMKYGIPAELLEGIVFTTESEFEEKIKKVKNAYDATISKAIETEKARILGEQGRDPQNPPHPTGKYTAEDLKKLSKQEIAKLFDEGKLNHLL